jgi:hypothetical protein
MGSGLILTVAYTGEPDEIYEFAEDGQARTFGRDDARCDIVIWSAINGNELSRVAGRIWRMDSELWLRNLSTRHELHVSTPGWPAEPPLPPRREDGLYPGPARSIPAELAFVRAPGGCELLVRQVRSRAAALLAQADWGDITFRVPSVPRELRSVAIALCAPLLSGGQLPAAYSEITRLAATGSLKRTRTMVADLCQLYMSEVPHLRDRILERRRREENELGLPADARLHRGVWRFDQTSQPSAEAEDVRRRRALALPDYYEVAYILVRRRLVTVDDLATLSAGADVEGSETVGIADMASDEADHDG